MSSAAVAGEPANALRRKIVALSPAAAAMIYPFLLQALHAVVSPADVSLSVIRHWWPHAVRRVGENPRNAGLLLRARVSANA